VCWAALKGTGFVVLEDLATSECALRAFVRACDSKEVLLEAAFSRSARALATASLALRILAADPKVFSFTPALRSAFCSAVRVLSPSWRYLNWLRSRLATFCGSCRVMMSLRANFSSLTRSCQFLALMFSLSTVSQLKTLPVFFSATIWVLSVKVLKETGST